VPGMFLCVFFCVCACGCVSVFVVVFGVGRYARRCLSCQLVMPSARTSDRLLTCLHAKAEARMPSLPDSILHGTCDLASNGLCTATLCFVEQDTGST
jgi:hypothetical protein